MDNDRYQIAIVGGGASGLMAAVSAAMILPGKNILLLEKGPEFGRKILATGNGRCNLSNKECRYSDYNPTGSITVKQVLGKMGPGDSVTLFEEIGLMVREDDAGRMYPYGEQAVIVRDLLAREAGTRGVKMRTEADVIKVVREESGEDIFFVLFLSDGSKLEADAVVIATGGKAGIQYGSTGDGYQFARDFGHEIISPRPALVPFVGSQWPHGNLKGVRVKGSVTLTRNGVPVAEKRGEIQFTDYGLSGICVFDLSRYYKGNDSQEQVVLDLFPDYTLEELEHRILARIKRRKGRDGKDVLKGMLHEKLIPVFSWPQGETPNSGELARNLKGWSFPIQGTKGWKEAQVTAGGVDCVGVFRPTLGSSLVSGLYFSGEVLDVDGPCGGWNLQWAWSSGFVAGESAALWLCSRRREEENQA